MFRRFVVSLAVSVSLLSGCADSDDPAVELWSDGVWSTVPVTDYSIDGRRDGRVTRATAIFALQGSGRLEVTFEVSYNPQPVLSGGRWQMEGAVSGEGEVVARSMKFFGGQAEGPSLGGRFQLEQDGEPRYRIYLPLRPVSAPDWGEIKAR